MDTKIIKNIYKNKLLISLILFVLLGLIGGLIFWQINQNQEKAKASGRVFYVSNSGDDSNSGLSENQTWKTISKVNQTDFIEGDQVLFKCGETWRGEVLTVKNSGTSANKIIFSSYPETNCQNKPRILGSLAVNNWVQDSGNIYFADLSSGSNASAFPNGINQLFQNDRRLPVGRWPNLDDSTFVGGYAHFDSGNGNQVTDSQLPNADWTGATMQFKPIRWLLQPNKVTADSGNTLTLENDPGCTNGCGSSGGWGYWLTNSKLTLDKQNEWFYDQTAKKLYIYSNSKPADNQIFASKIIDNQDQNQAGISIGLQASKYIENVEIKNLESSQWYQHGIGFVSATAENEMRNINIVNNLIQDNLNYGLKLASWAWNSEDYGNGENGWRGGSNILVENNLIRRSNQIGILTMSRNSNFIGNTIEDTAIISELTDRGMGDRTSDGSAIFADRQGGQTQSNNNFIENKIIRAGYNGIGLFGGPANIENNFITQACFTKGDCGAVTTFGSENLSNTAVFDVNITKNIIVNTIGNTDGDNQSYKELFGFGVYIDHYSRNVNVSENTVANSSNIGILFQNSEGKATNNKLYDNQLGAEFGGRSQLAITESNVAINGNEFYLHQRTLPILQVSNNQNPANNKYFAPYATGEALNGNSSSWFTQNSGESRKIFLFVNSTNQPKSTNLSGNYLNLGQQTVASNLTLEPFSSQILYLDSGNTPQSSITFLDQTSTTQSSSSAQSSTVSSSIPASSSSSNQTSLSSSEVSSIQNSSTQSSTSNLDNLIISIPPEFGSYGIAKNKPEIYGRKDLNLNLLIANISRPGTCEITVNPDQKYPTAQTPNLLNIDSNYDENGCSLTLPKVEQKVDTYDFKIVITDKNGQKYVFYDNYTFLRGAESSVRIYGGSPV